MLHVILLIFKILGIIFLVAVGLILLILYAVLFAAISYRADIRKKEDLKVVFFASWLFRAVTVRFRLNGENHWEPEFQMRLLGYPMWRNTEKESRWKRLKQFRTWIKKKFTSWRKRKRKTEEGKDNREIRIDESLTQDRKTLTQKPAESSENLTEESGRHQEDGIQSLDHEKTSGSSDYTERQKKRTIFRKIVDMVYGICRKVKQIWKKITGPENVFRKLLNQISGFLEFWNLEEHIRARKKIWDEFQYLWKKSRPRKIRGRIVFGFSDPADTGLCMGAAGMLCAWYPKKLEIIPDFEKEILEGELLVRGKVRFYVFVSVLWRVYRDKDIRHMHRHWRNDRRFL